jgi:hypothetical protein
VLPYPKMLAEYGIDVKDVMPEESVKRSGEK